MKKIVIDNKIPFIKGVFEPYFETVSYLPGAAIARGDLVDADALIVRTRTRCDAALLRGTPVRFIATATIGTDHIDEVFCRMNKIEWSNAAGCNAPGVAQYISSALLLIERRTGRSLAGRTLGVVGVGHVGKMVADVGHAFGMKVLLNDPPRAAREGAGEFSSLEKILSDSDFITLHVPLSRGGDNGTFHMADRNFFLRMKPGAFLLNAARGEVCCANDLKEVLRRREIGGAVLDVWENEPDIDRELQKLLVAGTPHIAGYSADGKARGTSMSVRAVAKFFGIGALADFQVALPDVADILTWTGSFYELQRRAYDIETDSRALLERPERFETLRNEYDFRRENAAYAVSGIPQIPACLLGFREAVK